MEIEAVEQFELERLDNLWEIFQQLELACNDGYLSKQQFQDLKFECGMNEEKV
jgi:hypothetical protein